MLIVENLRLGFAGKMIYDGFSLRLEVGEIAVISGPSGSGKTSLLRAVCGFIRPDSGAISIDGCTAEPKNISRYRQLMAYVPQHFPLTGITAREFIAQPFQFRCNAHLTPAPEKVKALLERFRLAADLPDKDFASLSGGERQRLGFIVALLLERRLLLLDEPTSALDHENRDILLATLAENKARQAILTVSHDPEMLAAADRIITVGGDK